MAVEPAMSLKQTVMAVGAGGTLQLGLRDGGHRRDSHGTEGTTVSLTLSKSLSNISCRVVRFSWCSSRLTRALSLSSATNSS